MILITQLLAFGLYTTVYTGLYITNVKNQIEFFFQKYKNILQFVQPLQKSFFKYIYIYILQV